MKATTRFLAALAVCLVGCGSSSSNPDVPAGKKDTSNTSPERGGGEEESGPEQGGQNEQPEQPGAIPAVDGTVLLTVDGVSVTPKSATAVRKNKDTAGNFIDWWLDIRYENPDDPQLKGQIVIWAFKEGVGCSGSTSVKLVEGPDGADASKMFIGATGKEDFECGLQLTTLNAEKAAGNFAGQVRQGTLVRDLAVQFDLKVR